MTSQAQSEEPLPGVRGLVFFGFPLHPSGKPSIERADHLDKVHIPMLLLQGTKDTLADLDLLRPVCERLGDRATLHIIETADHSFKVQKSAGKTDSDVLREMAQNILTWVRTAVDDASTRIAHG